MARISGDGGSRSTGAPPGMGTWGIAPLNWRYHWNCQPYNPLIVKLLHNAIALTGNLDSKTTARYQKIEGAVAQILQRAGEAAQPVAEKIKEQVITGKVIKSDETSARVEAKNWRHWIYVTHREKLLTFLHYPEVPPTNTESEQALRGSVVHRKVTNGFRSEWGAKAYAALQTVIATAKHKGEDSFQALVNLMGTPVLTFLEGAIP
jgi:hypothetical protein